MSRFDAAFQRLGGPGAVTWWAFFISLADRLITVSVQPANLSASFGVRVLATVLAQVVMFAPLLLLRFTLLKDPLRPRPWVALAGFAFADVLRALALDQFLYYLAGLPHMPALRVFSGFLPTLIPLIVTAYVVNTLRERRRELAVLLEVQERLAQSRAEAESTVLQRNEDLVHNVVSVLDAELAVLARKQPAEAVAQLQRTATDVVRPLSHELATSFATFEGPRVDDVTRQVSWREVMANAISERPLPVGLITLLLSGVFISAAVVFPPVRWLIVGCLLMMASLLALSNVVLRRIMLGRGLFVRIALVLLACVVTGVSVGLTLRYGSGDWPSPVALGAGGAAFVIGVSAGMAMVSGVLSARATVLADTATAVTALRAQVLRTRQLRWFHQRALARALHGPVQSAVTAAALQLADASPDDAGSADLIDGVRSDLMKVLDVLRSPQEDVSSLSASLSRIVGMWEGVCDVTTAVDPEASEEIESDVVVRACVIDIVTDAVSNAVRHAKAKSVGVDLRVEDDGLRITVTDDGAVTPKPGREGLGTALLNECALSWSLSSSEPGHTLTAVLQTSDSTVTPSM